MFKINNTTIYITHGDTLDAQIRILQADGSEYIPSEGDNVRYHLEARSGQDLGRDML
jgi:hypothetical protein